MPDFIAINHVISANGLPPSPGRKRESFNFDFPIVGEIGMFCGNFAPFAFFLTDGQLLSRNSDGNQLFLVIGNTFGKWEKRTQEMKRADGFDWCLFYFIDFEFCLEKTRTINCFKLTFSFLFFSFFFKLNVPT